MEPLVSIRNVNHYFGSGALRKQILFEISADVMPGEIVITTGPSGSGKTTLLTLIGGLRAVHEGSLRTLGREMNGATAGTLIEVRKTIGYVFQSHNLLEALKAWQNVQMALQLGPGLSGAEMRARCIEALAAVGLEEHVEKLPRQLSGGQKQRVAVARALVNGPKVILADEPTASLDKVSGREVVDMLQRLAREKGCAVLLVTHDHRILDIADRILALENGRIASFTSNAMASTGYLLTAFSRMHLNGDLARHVTSFSDSQFIGMLEQVTAECEQFLGVLDLTTQLAARAVLDEILEAVTLKIRELLSAERATLYLVDHDQGILWSKIAHHTGEQPLEIRIPITKGIAGQVARTGETLNIETPYNHPAFNPDIDQRTGYRTRNILCMPICDRSNRVFAVAQLLNKVGAPAFRTEDETAFRRFAPPLSAILEICGRLSKI